MPKPTKAFPPEPAIPPGGQRVLPDGSLEQLVEELTTHGGLASCVTHVHKFPPQAARYGDWPASLPAALVAALGARGIERPYIHQARALDLAMAGRHYVAVTPTASGKSLCYNVPVVDAVLRDPNSRALYLFPTKALSHDQYGELYELTKSCGGDIKVYTYDGDTPPAVRRSLRDAGHIVVTNPDMLHSGILPHHTGWVRLFENLKFVVIDELHQYRGVFGSHLGNVLRRLRRLCRFYGARPTFLCSSATIANPVELAEQLVGEKFELVNDSGAPTGEKTFVFFNPPVVNRELGVRRSVRLEARRVAMRFLAREHQVILFTRSRTNVEVITTYLKRGMKRLHRDPAQVAGYRGGYLPTERRAIERGLKDKTILGVVSTNALELGIDIGSLDVSILCGYPGTIASAWQQAGRAGRKARGSLVIYIAGSSPMDQFLVKHPEYLITRAPEEAIINPDNLAILASHLRCAAFELPFEDGEHFGPNDPAPLLQYLEDERIVRHTGNRWHYSGDVYPAEEVSLRTGVSENFIVLDTGEGNKVVAEVDYESAPFMIHDDAVYIHNGKTYMVEKLDWDRRTAHVRAKVVDYYTDAESSSTLKVMQVDDEVEAAAGSAIGRRSFGEVSVTTVVTKFKKVKFESQESIGYGPVTVPPLEIQTEAAWISLSPGTAARFKATGRDLGPALRAAAALLRHVIPLHVMCDPRDFGVQANVRSPFDQLPTITVWDRYPGGIGIARRFHGGEARALAAALDIVRDCPCREGCPACIGATLDAESGTKALARALLEQLTATAGQPSC